ncbi:MAG: mechanosensitive ion channel [Chloroflexi bacterium]|nr:mechanosensitive ion channel [Chloroflexota bacterium]
MSSRFTAILSLAIAVAILVAIGVSTGGIYVSLVAVGLALGLQKYIGSYFGYFLITFSQIFKIGDRIRIGNIKGDVKRIGIFHFMLEEVGEDEKLGGELTGRILHIPNLIVLDQAVLNYSKDYTVKGQLIHSEFIFDEIRVPLTPQSNIPKAVQTLEQILIEENRRQIEQAKAIFGQEYPRYIHEAEGQPHILIHVEPQHIWLKGKFVTPFRTRNEMRTKIYLRFMEQIGKEEDVHLV